MSGCAEGVPKGNLRVPRAQFATVWADAVRRHDDYPGTDWFVAAVVVTCRWLADSTVTPSWDRAHPARSPATGRELRAYPESIEAELVEAGLLAQRRPELAMQRPGWCEGIVATLRWAWRAEVPPPFSEAVAPREHNEP